MFCASLSTGCVQLSDPPADYKILARVLGPRLHGMIGSIIGHNQIYGVLGRDIADVVLLIQSTYERVMSEDGVFLSLDLEKAFDRVEHNFLFACLKGFGFGDEFVGWMKRLYCM